MSTTGNPDWTLTWNLHTDSCVTQDFPSVADAVKFACFLVDFRDSETNMLEKTNVPILKRDARSDGLVFISNIKKAPLVQLMVHEKCQRLNWFQNTDSTVNCDCSNRINATQGQTLSQMYVVFHVSGLNKHDLVIKVNSI